MIASVARVVTTHFDAYRKRSKGSFFWRISIEGVLVPLFAIAVIKLLVRLPSRTDLAQWTPFHFFIEAVVLAPFFETLLLQSLPVMIARSWGVGFWWQVLASIVPFAGAHFFVGVAAGIAAGMVGGFYIAFTYVHWRQKSFRSALWMTSGSHAIHNLLLFVIAMISGGA